MNDDLKSTDNHAESLPSALGRQAVGQKADSSSKFQTPEQIAAVDYESINMKDAADEDVASSHSPKKTKRFALHWPPSKREIIIAAVVLIILAGGLIGWFATHQSTKTIVAPKVVKVQKTAPASTTVPSDLTGLPVSPAVNERPVTGVMIENSLDARPQSGLGQAGVVFEAVAEGGITRFLALYQDTQPSNVGPIRSVRPYYLQWALGFDAAIAHVGGSPDALADITAWNVRDLDEFYNGNYYHRITTREAPHNVYTAITTLNQLEDAKGYTSSTFTSWPRKTDAPAKKPTAATINLTLSSSDYNVQYTYDAASDSYNRSEGGSPQIDANTNTQLSPKVVIAIVVPETQGSLDASGAYYSDYAVLGTGTAYVFQDGTVTTGQWSKSSNTTQITFSSSSGQPIKLNAGQTWITAVTSNGAVSYTP